MRKNMDANVVSMLILPPVRTATSSSYSSPTAPKLFSSFSCGSGSQIRQAGLRKSSSSSPTVRTVNLACYGMARSEKKGGSEVIVFDMYGHFGTTFGNVRKRWGGQEYKDRLTVVKIDHDANPKLIEEDKVYGLPALILFTNGKEVPESLERRRNYQLHSSTSI